MSGERSVVFYSHDTYGLGHLRRTLVIAHELRRRWPALTQLVVTGSPLAHEFQLPPGADYAKLPSVVKVGQGWYEPSALPIPFAAIRGLRSDLLLATARHFRPDLLLVDNVPAGLKGELVPTLIHLKKTSPGTRLVLGLRDVLDEPDRVRAAWRRQRVYELLDEVYDLILVYGDPAVCDVVAEYGLSRRAAAKTRYVGYLRREADPSRVAELRAELRVDDRPLVLATAGGGGDGYVLLRTLLEARKRWPAEATFDCVVAPGPFAAPAELQELAAMASNGSRARLIDFDPDLLAYMAASDAVVSMAGYNSISELVSLARPALIVPRVEPRQEQLIRARAVTRRGAGRMIHPAELTPRRLLTELNELLADPPDVARALPLDGLAATAAELDALLDARLAA
jgi:predicted glycosyltransferase